MEAQRAETDGGGSQYEIQLLPTNSPEPSIADDDGEWWTSTPSPLLLEDGSSGLSSISRRSVSSLEALVSSHRHEELRPHKVDMNTIEWPTKLILKEGRWCRDKTEREDNTRGHALVPGEGLDEQSRINLCACYLLLERRRLHKSDRLTIDLPSVMCIIG